MQEGSEDGTKFSAPLRDDVQSYANSTKVDDESVPSYTVTVQLPNGEKIDLPLVANDTIQEVRQFLADAPASCCTYTWMLVLISKRRHYLLLAVLEWPRTEQRG